MSDVEEYDVALSFAGEDRAYVDKVAELLKMRGVKVFYDLYEQANLWGKDLYVHLQEIYGKRSRYTVVFISRHYAEKVWTNHERKSAQARAFQENREYILPARFDDAEVAGILPTLGYIDLRNLSPEAFVNLIEAKLERQEVFWSAEATHAAQYLHQHHFEAHRGAILWCPQVSAIFANDGKKLENDYVSLLKDEISTRGLTILGTGMMDDEYTWAMLVNSEDARALHDLIWECFFRVFPDAAAYVSIQKDIALSRLHSYWRVPHKANCG
jgi:hypothetical protein